jgi:hypothetical protein
LIYLEKVFRGQSKDFNEIRNLSLLAFPWEYRLSCDKLHYNTAETPHINLKVIWQAQNDLRRPVKPTLYVSVQAFINVAATPEINDLDH